MYKYNTTSKGSSHRKVQILHHNEIEKFLLHIGCWRFPPLLLEYLPLLPHGVVPVEAPDLVVAPVGEELLVLLELLPKLTE